MLPKIFLAHSQTYLRSRYAAVTVVLCAIFCFGLLPKPVHAANIYSVVLPDGTWKIVVDGQLVNGDAKNFDRVLFDTKKKGKVSSVHLNSPGGYVHEGYAIGREMSEVGVASVVERGAHCESACFLMFIGGYPRIVTQYPRIGVHRASVNGVDDHDATQNVIDLAYRLGVIDEQILRRIGSAPPSGMNYLTNDQLRMIDVNVRP